MHFSWSSPEDEEEFHGIDGDDDMIYEDIEAPKYVDFSAQERSLLPEDSSWFCARIGCNQKHEEIDPDTLYKNFVQRVMAARSPNVVRLHKSLRQQDRRCPKTEPVKCVHDHRLRFAEKLGNERIKAHPISSLRSTPNPKTRNTQPSRCLKDVATPRSKKKVSKKATSESSSISSSSATSATRSKKLEKPLVSRSPKKVQNSSITPWSKKKKSHSKEATLGSSSMGSSFKAKNRELGKPLASQTPEKVWNSFTSRTSQTPKPRLCSAQKKLQMDSRSKSNPKYSSSKSSKDQQKDPSNHKIATSLKSCTEEERLNSDKTDEFHHYSDAHQEGNAAESSDIQVDAKSERSSEECVSKDGTADSTETHPVKHLDDKSFDDKENTSEIYCNKVENVISQNCDQSLRKAATGKENDASSDNNFDDKENASATCGYRKIHLMKRVMEKVDSQNCYPSLQKPLGGVGKCLYKKMKPTHPKPFRLRTDERGILKEANLEKRIQQEPMKEMKAAVMNPPRKKLENSNTVNTDLKLESNKTKLRSLHSCASSKSNGTSANLPSKVRKNERAPKLKDEAAAASTTPLRIRKPTTIPKEPVFHKIHVPKDCTKRPLQLI